MPNINYTKYTFYNCIYHVMKLIVKYYITIKLTKYERIWLTILKWNKQRYYSNDNYIFSEHYWIKTTKVTKISTEIEYILSNEQLINHVL